MENQQYIYIHKQTKFQIYEFIVVNLEISVSSTLKTRHENIQNHITGYKCKGHHYTNCWFLSLSSLITYTPLCFLIGRCTQITRRDDGKRGGHYKGFLVDQRISRWLDMVQ